MKSFKEFKGNINEAVPQQPQKPVSNQQNDAARAQRLSRAASLVGRKTGISSSLIKTSVMRMDRLRKARPNDPYSKQIRQLSPQLANALNTFQTNFALNSLDDTRAFNMAMRNVREETLDEDQSNLPSVLNLRRTGVRVFPDGRKVGMYINNQLGLMISIPFAGTGKTPGEVIPGGVQVVHATNEEVDVEDKGEYDYEGDMAISQLKSIISNSMKLKDMLEPDTNLPEWVQAKITLAEDYVVTAANYMEGQQDQGAGDSLDEETEQLDETQNVRVVGRKKIIRARIRAGKVQRRKVVSAVPGYKMVGGQVKRESAKERLDRKRGARKAKIKRRAKMARALIKRKRSLRKRESMGLNR